MKIMDTLSDTLRSKLQNLLSYLTQVTRGFESIAQDIESTNLKTAMIAISSESKQYVAEINDQLQEFDKVVFDSAADGIWQSIEMNTHEQASFLKGGEIVALCNNCEIYYNSLYKEILEEYFPHKNFKDLITFQFYATQCAFMKIRILNKLRFVNTGSSKTP